MILNGLPWRRTEIILLFLRLHPSTAFRTLVDHDGYSISSEGFLPAVVDRHTKRGREELPYVQGQGQWPRLPGYDGTGTAKRSYPASEVSGSREETPRIQGQGQLGEATSCPRPGVVTLRSHLKPKARGSSWEEQPEERWLRRHRRA